MNESDSNCGLHIIKKFYSSQPFYSLAVLNCVIEGCLPITSVGGSILLLVAVFKFPQLREVPSNILLASQAVADLLIGLVIQPYLAARHAGFFVGICLLPESAISKGFINFFLPCFSVFFRSEHLLNNYGQVHIYCSFPAIFSPGHRAKSIQSHRRCFSVGASTRHRPYRSSSQRSHQWVCFRRSCLVSPNYHHRLLLQNRKDCKSSSEANKSPDECGTRSEWARLPQHQDNLSNGWYPFICAICLLSVWRLVCPLTRNRRCWKRSSRLL